MGITKTITRTKQLFYFPCINTQIENLILSCLLCLKYSSFKIKEPVLCHEIPELPFYKSAIYIVDFSEQMYLVV